MSTRTKLQQDAYDRMLYHDISEYRADGTALSLCGAPVAVDTPKDEMRFVRQRGGKRCQNCMLKRRELRQELRMAQEARAALSRNRVYDESEAQDFILKRLRDTGFAATPTLVQAFLDADHAYMVAKGIIDDVGTMTLRKADG